MTIRVLLVDDDPMVSTGLELVLETATDIKIVGAISDGDEVLGAVDRLNPHVVLMDVRMLRMDGITAAAQLARKASPPRVIILTTLNDEHVVQQAIHASISGFLLKKDAPGVLVDAIRNVTAGHGAMSPASLGSVLRSAATDVQSSQRLAARQLIARLSDRERDVVRCVGQQMSNQEIATALHLALSTVKSHLASAQIKLNVDNRMAVGQLADRAGLLINDQ